MRNILLTLALTASVVGVNAQTLGKSDNGTLTGDYLEARTASVFAGACHYNGEVTTTGREAEMAWHIREGVWKGTSLAGLSALASVVSDANLQDETAPRRSTLYIDARATPAQFEALSAALQARYSSAFGKVVAVKRAPISFARTGEKYRVEAKGVTLLSVEAMPNHECCKQPNMVWYKPLIEIKDRKVGYTRESGIQDKTLGVTWTKSDQNTAFYGAFTL
jgi:hypothetical protein